MRVAILFLLIGAIKATAAIETRHYFEWYPAYGYIFAEKIREDCSDDFNSYATGSSPHCDGQSPTCLSNRVVSCVLDLVSENVKSNMASASVVLGLLPSAMGMTASDLTEMGILAQHRPVLSVLLTLGAPVLSPIRTFEFINPMHVLKDAEEAMSLPALGGYKAASISALQYVLAAAAATNLLHMGFELGVKAVCSFSPNTVFLPLVWIAAALPIHAFGTWAVRLRLKIADSTGKGKTPNRMLRWIRGEGQLCMLQPSKDAEPQPKSYSFIFILWCTSVGIIIHLVLGTLILSGTLFVNTEDALVLAVRFLASMIVCRAIVTFEMNGVKMNLAGGKWSGIAREELK